MKTYDVMIRGSVRKTMRVEAEDEDRATEIAHEEFTTASTDQDEAYNEETVSCLEVKA